MDHLHHDRYVTLGTDQIGVGVGVKAVVVVVGVGFVAKNELIIDVPLTRRKQFIFVTFNFYSPKETSSTCIPRVIAMTGLTDFPCPSK